MHALEDQTETLITLPHAAAAEDGLALCKKLRLPADHELVAGFEARGEIDRRDFNVSFEGSLENGSLVVGNKIVLELSIEALQDATVSA